MGKRILYRGVIVGAIIGGITALFNNEAREYAKLKLRSSATCAKYYIKNPSEAVHNVRVAFDEFNKDFAEGAENTMNALEQVESTLEKVIKKKDKNEMIQ